MKRKKIIKIYDKKLGKIWRKIINSRIPEERAYFRGRYDMICEILTKLCKP